MTVPSLTSLLIENLRGAVTPFTLAFEKGRKLTIVYGENGTGKSTISDAFDLLGNGIVGSLEKRGVGGATRPYWPSVGKAHGDVKVVLTTSDGTCTLSLGRTNVLVDNEKLKPEVKVLRRSQILNLVAAKPAERYSEIQKFIDVSGVEASEEVLRKLILYKSREYETATTRLSANKTSIELFWNEVGKPLPDAFAWAKSEIKKDRQELDKRKAAIDGLISCWNRIISHPDKLNDFTSRLKTAQDNSMKAQTSLEAITGEVASDYLEVLDILKAAQQHFIRHPNLEVCPLCESGEKAAGLMAEVNRRIQAQGLHAKLDEAKKNVAAHVATVKREQQRFDDYVKNSKEDFAELEAYCGNTEQIQDLELPAFPYPEEPEKWGEWIDVNKHKHQGWRQTSDACVDSKKFVETLRSSLKEYEESELIATDLAAVLPRLRNILSIVANERKKYTDNILSDISTRVGELYEILHPGEGLNRIVLALDAAKRASLEIAIEFGGKADAPPQAYFSDSHLDTLGLCVFVALAERETPEKSILVLDDVLGSVDEPHVERVIDLIYAFSQKFQHAIVTTHYRPWKEKFRWGLLKPDHVCQFVELKHWSPTGGIVLTGSVPEIGRLKTLLAEPDPDVQAITGKAGVILEAILDFLTLKYSCAVPRNPGNAYVLGELLSAVNGRLQNALRIEIISADEAGTKTVTEIPLKDIFDNIKLIAQARNVLGAHFNPRAFELHPTDGIGFAKLVSQLSDALICPDHGWPTKDTGTYWKNGGDTRRLHPLRKPA